MGIGRRNGELLEKKFDIRDFEPETSFCDNIWKCPMPYQFQQLQQKNPYLKDKHLQLPPVNHLRIVI